MKEEIHERIRVGERLALHRILARPSWWEAVIDASLESSYVVACIHMHCCGQDLRSRVAQTQIYVLMTSQRFQATQAHYLAVKLVKDCRETVGRRGDMIGSTQSRDKSNRC